MPTIPPSIGKYILAAFIVILGAFTTGANTDLGADSQKIFAPENAVKDCTSLLKGEVPAVAKLEKKIQDGTVKAEDVIESAE